jgi:excinuclease ABC subunit A
MTRYEKNARAAARTTIAVEGDRVHNLKNISLEIPRDRLIVVTGLSGSGKSSLAFDTIYAEGQRRYMESLSSYAKRFVAQVAKPDVDFVFGLSPVISIEQKTLTNNPRSTVGTMTDIASYLNLLFATIGQPHCPRTGEPTPSRTSSQILEAILSLPEGTEIELRAPVFKVYGEELDFVFTELRKKGCRRVIVDGKSVDIAAHVEVDESAVQHMDAVVDRFVVGRKHEKAIKAGIAAALLVGDGLLRVHVVAGTSKAEAEKFYRALSSATHHLVYGDIGPDFFVFNNPESVADVRRARRGQAHAPRTADSRSEAEPARRLLRARSVQVQPGHVGRPGDVQPLQGARLFARFAVEGPAQGGARRDSLRHRSEENRADLAAGSQGQAR